MKIKYIVVIVLSLSILGACRNSEENTPKDKTKAKIVEVLDNNTAANKQKADETTTKEANSSAKETENVFEGTFEDASALEMTFYYFFKDASGKEITFFYDPKETQLDLPVQFLGSDLSVNKDLVGKLFKIKYKKVKREDENTGEMTTFNIPVSIEKK